MSTLRGQFTNPIDAAAYLFAGKATLTLVSRATGVRYTFKVCEKVQEDMFPRGPAVHFVKVLTGPNNEEDYGYLGTIFGKETYRHGRKSKIGETAPSAVAFHWFFNKLKEARTGAVIFKHLEVWHEGTCGRCGRKLTVPESVARGFGPVCDGIQEAA